MNGQRMLNTNDPLASTMVTLLIVSAPDIASVIQGDALLARGGWTPCEPIEGGDVWQHERADVCLWWFGERVLMEDNLDLRFHTVQIKPLKRLFFCLGITLRVLDQVLHSM